MTKTYIKKREGIGHWIFVLHVLIWTWGLPLFLIGLIFSNENIGSIDFVILLEGLTLGLATLVWGINKYFPHKYYIDNKHPADYEEEDIIKNGIEVG